MTTHQPRTILLVGAFAFPLHQGSQVYVGGMARALARRGHRVLLACYGHGVGDWPEGVEPIRGLHVPGLGVSRSGPHAGKPLLDLGLAARIAQVLRRERVDVIHAHNVEAPFVAALARRLVGSDVPIVYNLHTSLEEELPVYWTDGILGRLARPMGRGVDRWLARRAHASIAISQGAARRLRDWGASCVHLVTPGVDVEELGGGDGAAARRRWSLQDGPWVVYTGNADPYQDLDVLLAAVASSRHARLLVVTGDAARVRELAEPFGLGPDRLRVVSSTRFEDARDALAVAALSAVPRRVCAGFPIKLLNSLGSGVPTVCAEGSAQPIPGVVVVPDGDVAALAATLDALLVDEGRRLALGQAAAAAIADAWTWDAAAVRLEAAYDAVL